MRGSIRGNTFGVCRSSALIASGASGFVNVTCNLELIPSTPWCALVSRLVFERLNALSRGAPEGRDLFQRCIAIGPLGLSCLPLKFDRSGSSAGPLETGFIGGMVGYKTPLVEHQPRGIVGPSWVPLADPAAGGVAAAPYRPTDPQVCLSKLGIVIPNFPANLSAPCATGALPE